MIFLFRRGIFDSSLNSPPCSGNLKKPIFDRLINGEIVQTVNTNRSSDTFLRLAEHFSLMSVAPKCIVYHYFTKMI